jgi:hypothetical protein
METLWLVIPIVILAIWCAAQQSAINEKERQFRIAKNRIRFLEENALSEEMRVKSRADNVTTDWY